MTLDSFVNGIIEIFLLLNETKIFNVPVLVWLAIVAVFGMLGMFIKGKKEDKE